MESLKKPRLHVRITLIGGKIFFDLRKELCHGKDIEDLRRVFAGIGTNFEVFNRGDSFRISTVASEIDRRLKIRDFTRAIVS
jgi:hypothetical protein